MCGIIMYSVLLVDVRDQLAQQPCHIHLTLCCYRPRKSIYDELVVQLNLVLCVSLPELTSYQI